MSNCSQSFRKDYRQTHPVLQVEAFFPFTGQKGEQLESRKSQLTKVMKIACFQSLNYRNNANSTVGEEVCMTKIQALSQKIFN